MDFSEKKPPVNSPKNTSHEFKDTWESYGANAQEDLCNEVREIYRAHLIRRQSASVSKNSADSIRLNGMAA